MKLKLTPELAEICGIHAGDGYLRNKGNKNELDISGGLEERDYYNSHVIPLFEDHFKINILGKEFPSRNTFGFVIRKKEIIRVMHKIGFPYGKKTLIVEVPQFILESENTEFQKRFLRGLFDTDGHVGFFLRKDSKSEFKRKKPYYPRIIYTSCSKKLITQTQKLINNFKIVSHIQVYNPPKKTENTKYKLAIHGKNNVCRLMELIDSKNPVKTTRFLIWKQFGYCPTRTNYKQRIKIINEGINLNNT